MPTRRDFLVQTASALATAALLPVAGSSMARAADGEPVNGNVLLPSTNPIASSGGKKLGWALVGIGKLTVGQILPAIANCRSSRLVALVTGHPDKAPPIVEKFSLNPANVYSYETYDKLSDNPDIDIVYNILPNGMHAEYTIRALKAGKHVLCEKPMANTSVECRQMIDAAKSAGKKLMIAYRIRHEPNNQNVIEICRSNQFGKPRFIITDHCFHLTNPDVWRLNKKLAGGGALLDVGIYGLNATRYLTGEEPASVTAELFENPTDPRFKEVEEGVAWTMKFPSGVMATCTTSYNAAGTNRCRILCEKGMIDMEPATGYHGIKVRAGGTPITLPDIDQFAAEMDYFSQCLMTGKDPITPGEEGLKDLKIMEAIYEAARSGRTVRVA